MNINYLPDRNYLLQRQDDCCQVCGCRGPHGCMGPPTSSIQNMQMQQLPMSYPDQSIIASRGFGNFQGQQGVNLC